MNNSPVADPLSAVRFAVLLLAVGAVALLAALPTVRQLLADAATAGSAGHGAAAGEVRWYRCPAYRVEPPDILQIEMLKMVPLPPYRIEVYDVLQIRVAGTLLTSRSKISSWSRAKAR